MIIQRCKIHIAIAAILFTILSCTESGTSFSAINKVSSEKVQPELKEKTPLTKSIDNDVNATGEATEELKAETDIVVTNNESEEVNVTPEILDLETSYQITTMPILLTN